MAFPAADPKASKYKVFPARIDGTAYSWCPSMDLLAVSTGKNVLVLRMNGKVVWELDLLGGLTKSLCWRPDGKQLAVLTTKNNCLIFDVNGGNLVSNLSDEAGFGVWTITQHEEAQSKSKYLNCNDITKALPRLPPLPNSNSDRVRFATKQAIDSLIQNEKVDDLDVLFLFGEHKVNVTLHGLFSIGPVELLQDNVNDEEIVNHVPQDMESQYILTSSFMTMKHTLRRFKTSFADNYDTLQDLTTSSSKIIALLGYIEEILTFTTQEVKTYLDFNSRFIGIIKDELSKKDENVVDELYNLLLTGMMNDELKDWLGSSIGDRGVKRWAKIGETTFENVRRTLLYHLVPSSERLIILLSNLEARSKSSILTKDTFEIKFLDESIQNVKSFLKLVFEFIIKINREQELFQSYITWINFALVELQEEDTSKYVYKTSEVSEFINSHLERSVLFMLIPNLRRNYNEIRINTTDLFDSIKSHIKQSLISDDFNIELGRATEKQKLVILDEEIFCFSHYDDILEVYKVDKHDTVEARSVKFGFEVLDIQITDNEEIYVLSGDTLRTFSIQQLFLNVMNEQNIEDIEILKQSQFGSLNPKYLTINHERNIGCLISKDHQRYHVFFLEDQ